MPLALPTADERTFASLVDDARARLPRLAPAWTDYNAHDPGITLIELLAHLTETDLYRLARVTAAQRRAFLRWFGIEAGGPTVAETIVAFVPPAGGAGTISVAADREIVSASEVPLFSTTEAVTVQTTQIVGLFAGERRLWPRTGASPNAGSVAVLDTAVATFGPRGEENFTIALDGAASGEVTLYVWTGAPDHDDDTRLRLQEELAAVARDRQTARHACASSRLDDWRRHYEVDVTWEIFTASGWSAARVVEDRTRALTISGFVRLVPEQPMVAGGVPAMPAAFALRARRARGRFDAPPSVTAVLLNAAPARHQSRAFSVGLGTSDGCAGQRLRVQRGGSVPEPGAPIVFEQTTVTVTPPAAPAEFWHVATDGDRASADDPVVVIDAEAATISFGDGRRGRVPTAGALIDLASRVGGGAAGNLPAGTLVSAPAGGGQPALAVMQPFAARGGGPAPDLATLQARLLARLARPTRAATLADIERLVRETPGVCVGRTLAIAEHDPRFPGLPALGCVCVVVVPQGPGPRFEPTRGLLAAVRAYLDRRRPLTTELHVVAPSWAAIAVRARMHLAPHADAAVVLARASARLDAFFHPLTGGADGAGWPVGRDVYRSEILALLQELPGVHHIDELVLLSGQERAPLCDDATVCPTDLIAPGKHEITIDPTRIR